MRFLNMSKLVQIQYDTNCYSSCDFQTCLNMLKHVQTCSDLWIVMIHVILKHVWTCWNMSELVQVQYDTNCYNSCDSQTCLNMFKHVWTCSDSIWYELLRFMWFSNMSEHAETCLNLFRFNMIWIVTSYDEIQGVSTHIDRLWRPQRPTKDNF